MLLAAVMSIQISDSVSDLVFQRAVSTLNHTNQLYVLYVFAEGYQEEMYYGNLVFQIKLFVREKKRRR